MKLLWEYPLPRGGEPRDYEYAGPIRIHQGKVYYAGYADPASTSAAAERYVVRLHRIDRERGTGEEFDFELAAPGLPGSWSFTPVGEQLWLHCGAFIRATGNPTREPDIPAGALAPEKQAARPSPLVLGSRVVFGNERDSTLYCFDTAEGRLAWSRALTCEKPYRVGDPQPFGEQIACYGRDALLLLDPASGEVRDEIRIPRVDKLYSPLADGNDLLLGYTNWSTAGVIRYHRPTRKVLWQHRRKFEGPNSYCRIWRVNDVVVWVKGETELIGVDAATGEERWRTRTDPFLYSRLEVFGTDLLFGTAGRGGEIQVVDGLTGVTRWARSLNAGCEYYARDATTVFVGDFDGCVRRLDLRTGTKRDQFHLGTGIVGDVALDGDRLYTVAWPDTECPPRVLCIRTHR